MDSPIVINSTIQEQVYQIIRHEVVNRVFHEGEQLKEAELAQRFNVSRSPVREALHRLAGDGMLTIIPNRGIFVKEFDEKYIIDVLELRSLLEQRAIVQSRHKLNPVLTDKMNDMRCEMTKLIENNDISLDKHAALDTEFHNFIMDINDNTFISEVAAKISALNSMFRYISLKNGDRAIESQREHIAMIDTMLSGDTEQATEIYKKHIEGTKRRVMKEFVRRQNNR
ncbi:MAG: GntR family transcriptional regulator [Candidatus Heteroscillospira sp.]